MIVQIYEIQDAQEAEEMVRLGVDHIGSVIMDSGGCSNLNLRELVKKVQAAGAKSSIIPLFEDIETIIKALRYYRPDIVHLCTDLPISDADGKMTAVINIQIAIRKSFPDIEIMRSIPIGLPGLADRYPSLEWAARLEPFTDWFLTDTRIDSEASLSSALEQPVPGFIGITGRTCDWNIAGALVRQSRIPVILAGGLGPDNVDDAISQVHPIGVDSCTLTNATDEFGNALRFMKDKAKVNAFVLSARASAAPLYP